MRSTTLRNAMGPYGDEIFIEGSDGIGRKTQAPWTRISARSSSPSATTGYYVVMHFSTDGTRLYVTLGCGSTKWDTDRGDLRFYSDTELERRVSWAHDLLEQYGFDLSRFPDAIDIGATTRLPRSFEKATVLCKTFQVDQVTDQGVFLAIQSALEMLPPIYDAHATGADLLQSEPEDKNMALPGSVWVEHFG